MILNRLKNRDKQIDMKETKEIYVGEDFDADSGYSVDILKLKDWISKSIELGANEVNIMVTEDGFSYGKSVELEAYYSRQETDEEEKEREHEYNKQEQERDDLIKTQELQRLKELKNKYE